MKSSFIKPEREPLLGENSVVQNPQYRTADRKDIIDKLVYYFQDNELQGNSGLNSDYLKKINGIEDNNLACNYITIDKLFFVGKPRGLAENNFLNNEDLIQDDEALLEALNQPLQYNHRRIHQEYFSASDKIKIQDAVSYYQQHYENDPTPTHGNIYDRLTIQDDDRDNEFCAMTFCKQEFDKAFTQEDIIRESSERISYNNETKKYKYEEKIEKWEAAETLLHFQIQLVEVLKQRHRNERIQTFYNRDRTREFEKTLNSMEKKLLANLENRKKVLENWKNQIPDFDKQREDEIQKNIDGYEKRINEIKKFIKVRTTRDTKQDLIDTPDVVEVSRPWNEVLLDGLKGIVNIAKSIKDSTFLSDSWNNIKSFGSYISGGIVYVWNNPLKSLRAVINGIGNLLYEAQAAIYQLQIWWTSERLFGQLRIERIIDIANGIKQHAKTAYDMLTLHATVLWGSISYLFNVARDMGIVFALEPARPAYAAFHDWLTEKTRDGESRGKRPWLKRFFLNELLPTPARRTAAEKKMPWWKLAGKRFWNAFVEDGWRKGSKLYNIYNDGTWGIFTNLTVILLILFMPPVGAFLALLKGIINTWAFFADIQNEGIVAAHDWTDYSYLYFENQKRMEAQDKVITYLNGKVNLEEHERNLLQDLLKEKQSCELLQEQLYKNFVRNKAEPSETFLGTIVNGIKATWASLTSSVVMNRLVRVLPGVTICFIGMVLFFFVPGAQLPGAILAFIGGSVMTGFTPRVINFIRDEFPKLIDVFKKVAEYARELWSKPKVELTDNVVNQYLDDSQNKEEPPKDASAQNTPNTSPENSNTRLSTSTHSISGVSSSSSSEDLHIGEQTDTRKITGTRTTTTTTPTISSEELTKLFQNIKISKNLNRFDYSGNKKDTSPQPTPVPQKTNDATYKKRAGVNINGIMPTTIRTPSIKQN